ncbi:glycoside hydrolase 64/thaumatin family protein [Phytopseudomonas dryadis]|uniref:Uncharacterized protein n=1 Tax=Phytopseudomonas dryadis TaxID=2487520 RepID=A0A4Q9QVX4_9GAMM|nr:MULTISPECIES: hypothetical protein [Pseudomonas]TBU88177.1 hypothetical protein DNK44_19150 [Pseudomonas dryadis]TBV05373.1 hypothetical protein DNK34_12565 [Pseudomonas dryadis]TBV18383.1 hypothetical protein DNK41_08355 [Pseudomonas sp. FRB 230]
MTVDNIGQFDGLPGPNEPGLEFDAVLRGAWQGEWTRREQARDEARAAGDEALAQHYQNELDVLRLMMPSAEPLPPLAGPTSEIPLQQRAVTEQIPPVTQDELPAVAPGALELGGTPPEGNSLTFVNDGDTPLTIEFTANAGEAGIESITLQPGESLVQSFPEGWSGNFRSSAGDGAHVTLGEVAFNGGVNGDQTFYDVSYIEGNNARMTIAPSEGGPVSGTLEDIVSDAPDGIKARDADGNVYGLKKSTTSEVFDESVVDYYRSAVGEGEGYVVPKDDISTLGTASNSLTVRIA